MWKMEFLGCKQVLFNAVVWELKSDNERAKDCNRSAIMKALHGQVKALRIARASFMAWSVITELYS